MDLAEAAQRKAASRRNFTLGIAVLLAVTVVGGAAAVYFLRNPVVKEKVIVKKEHDGDDLRVELSVKVEPGNKGVKRARGGKGAPGAPGMKNAVDEFDAATNFGDANSEFHAKTDSETNTQADS